MMQVEIRIDESCAKPKIIIMTASMTEEINRVVAMLSENVPQIISGSKDDKVEVLEQANLIRIYASGGKVFAGIRPPPPALRVGRTPGCQAIRPHLEFGNRQLTKSQ